MKAGNTRSGVTLIEMLTVVTVIAILAGMIFKLFTMAIRTGERAATVAVVEQLAMAVNEYRAVYGSYPPVDPGLSSVSYVFQDWTNSTVNAQQEMYDDQNISWLYTYGLMSFLVPRFQGGNVTVDGHSHHADGWELGQDGNWQVIQDTPRDLAAKESWANFLSDILSGGVGGGLTPVGKWKYKLGIVTVRDAWGRDLMYQSIPPHQSYIVWSSGPNGTNEGGKGDDIATGTMQ